jgi:biotin carboxyl carrier protein
MEHRLNEILDEVIKVRKEFGYPVMATPYSQIVGAQAVENVVSGERYKTITDEAIKYALNYYGEPVAPIDQNVLDRIMSLPRTKEFLNWKAEGYLKSVEELRQEIGSELSDDDLILKILIPGKSSKKAAPKKKAVVREAKSTAPASSIPSATVPPREFSVEVDGEVFTVKISPLGGEANEAVEAAIKDEPKSPEASKKVPEGAVVCDIAGLVLSLEVKVGDKVGKGDLIAVIEAMKMRRPIHSSRGGTVKRIFVDEGQIVGAEDILMVVE